MNRQKNERIVIFQIKCLYIELRLCKSQSVLTLVQCTVHIVQWLWALLSRVVRGRTIWSRIVTAVGIWSCSSVWRWRYSVVIWIFSSNVIHTNWFFAQKSFSILLIIHWNAFQVMVIMSVRNNSHCPTVNHGLPVWVSIQRTAGTAACWSLLLQHQSVVSLSSFKSVWEMTGGQSPSVCWETNFWKEAQLYDGRFSAPQFHYWSYNVHSWRPAQSLSFHRDSAPRMITWPVKIPLPFCDWLCSSNETLTSCYSPETIFHTCLQSTSRNTYESRAGCLLPSNNK